MKIRKHRFTFKINPVTYEKDMIVPKNVFGAIYDMVTTDDGYTTINAFRLIDSKTVLATISPDKVIRVLSETSSETVTLTKVN